MNITRIILNALLLTSGAFLLADAQLDMVNSDIEALLPRIKMDKAMLLELAKAVAELKSATADLKEVRTKEQELKKEYESIVQK